MTRLFALAIFASATLLFMLQPLVGKILLPVLGGSPAVWSTCMVFFQAVLLVGYLYAHAVGTRVPAGWQRPLHVAVLIAASAVLPVPIDVGEAGAHDPRWWVLRVLAGTVGLPFFALAATAPLLQHWLSRTDDAAAGDPYFLYAASNAGSLLGLLGYLAIEPFAARSTQAMGWSVGFWIVAALVAMSAFTSRGHQAPIPAPAAAVAGKARGGRKNRAVAKSSAVAISALPASQYALWIVLALVPSALLLGVTQHLTTDVVSAPLLWVGPLALYLVTFILAFSRTRFGNARLWGRIAPAAALLVLILGLAEIRYPILPITLVHVTVFTVLAMSCHTRLAETRPDTAHLTAYYVCISAGGAIGGAAVALVAPTVFSSILEYPLAIVAALLLRPQTEDVDRASSSSARWMWRGGAVAAAIAAYASLAFFNTHAGFEQFAAGGRFAWLGALVGNEEIAQQAARAALVIPVAILLVLPRMTLIFVGAAAGLLIGVGMVTGDGEVLHRERTFFGVHQVTSVQNGAWHVLTHGTTTHGIQATGGRLRTLPTVYYHPTGPLGDVVFTLSAEGRFHDVGAIGLGAGALAAYANGIRMDFFEIDDAVIRTAENPAYFTYLSDARARPGTTVRTMAIDGRLGIGAQPPASYDLLVVDAFSSDAIPTHLITREAIALYVSRLKAQGVMAFHVSSRFFNLEPVLARIARELGLVCYARHDRDMPPERVGEAMRASVWVVLARSEGDLGQLPRTAPRWNRAAVRASDPLWTDDYTNLLGILED